MTDHLMTKIEKYLDQILFEPGNVYDLNGVSKTKVKPISGEIIYHAKKEYMGTVAEIDYLIRANKPSGYHLIIIARKCSNLNQTNNGKETGNRSATESL